MGEDVRAYAESQRSTFERFLRELVEIPTVSADPARKGDMQRCAETAAELIRSLGGQASIWPTSGNPIVFGRFEGRPDYPGLAFYNHLDVQPADEPEWKSDPFRLRVEDGRYIGRGATDDKGPAVACLLAAKYAYDRGLPLNFYFIWELEEEIGSPHFEEGLQAHRSEVRVRSVFVSDSIWISRDRPSVDYGLRGLQGATLYLRTAEVDAHSGVTGGAAPNPIAELCRILMACFDPGTGEVKIPHFYDDVVPPTEEELDNFVQSGFDVERFRKTYGFRWLRTEDLRELLKRIWAWPTFEVHGIAGGYQGPGIKTIIPHWAEAKVSMRLVPNQVPEKVFQLLADYVRQLNPLVEVRPHGSLAPYVGEFKGPHADALRRAVRRAFGIEPAFIREGGSIGAVLTMKKLLDVPILMMGLSLPEHGYHAPNEYFDWDQARRGIEVFNYYFEELAQLYRG